MNNNITEDYCSFEVSKLLKEKGFEQVTDTYYDSDGDEYGEDTYGNSSYKFKIIGECYRPTHSLAIKWISENYGKDEILHLNFEMDSEEIEKELLNIISRLDKK